MSIEIIKKYGVEVKWKREDVSNISIILYSKNFNENLSADVWKKQKAIVGEKLVEVP